MFQTEDQNPGEGGAGEAIEPTDPILAPQDPDTPSGDPLDDIQDPIARADAKKWRAIARRPRPDIVPPKPAAPVPSTPTEFVKKDDLAILVTNQAKELVSDEIRNAWDDLMKIPLSGFNPLDARSIAKNMAERLALHKIRLGTPKADNAGASLQTTPGVRGSSPATPASDAPPPPRFTMPVEPKDWYPKQS